MRSARLQKSLRINKIYVLLVFITLLFSIFLTEKVSALAKTSDAGNIYDFDIKLYPKEIIAGDGCRTCRAETQ